MTAARLARLGGQLARERFLHTRVAFKDDGSMVTDIDLLVQERLSREIAAAFPDDAVAGEEGLPSLTGRRQVWQSCVAMAKSHARTSASAGSDRWARNAHKLILFGAREDGEFFV